MQKEYTNIQNIVNVTRKSKKLHATIRKLTTIHKTLSFTLLNQHNQFLIEISLNIHVHLSQVTGRKEKNSYYKSCRRLSFLECLESDLPTSVLFSLILYGLKRSFQHIVELKL